MTPTGAIRVTTYPSFGESSSMAAFNGFVVAVGGGGGVAISAVLTLVHFAVNIRKQVGRLLEAGGSGENRSLNPLSPLPSRLDSGRIRGFERRLPSVRSGPRI